MPIKNMCKRSKSGKGKGEAEGEINFLPYIESREQAKARSTDTAKLKVRTQTDCLGPAHLWKAAPSRRRHSPVPTCLRAAVFQPSLFPLLGLPVTPICGDSTFQAQLRWP